MRQALALVVLLAGCGRVGFDLHGDGGAGSGDDGADAIDAAFGDAPMARSCMPALDICGPTGTRDCCETLPVPGGSFFRTYDVGADLMFPTMDAPARVSSFWLDTYEVTVGRYRQYVLAGGGTQMNPPAAGAGARMLNGMANQGGWDAAWTTNLPLNPSAQQTALACGTLATWTANAGANEALPINCTTWYDAMAFCIWDGGWLPTEAEWNYAASGGSEQRVYPWSNPASTAVVDCNHVNYYNGTTYCTNDPNGGASPAGSRSPAGDGRWGQADLSGNEWEWNLDYDGTYPMPCDDCANFTASAARVMRGGYFKNSSGNMRPAHRSSVDPASRVIYTGIRCARPVGG